MFDLKELLEKKAGLVDKAEAISNLVKREDREPTDEEKSELDKILDVAVPDIKAQIVRAEKLEAEVQALADRRTQDDGNLHNRVTTLGGGDEGREELPADQIALCDRITIPAISNFMSRTPRAFTGPKAKEKSYIAGRFFMAALYEHEDSRTWCNDHSVQWRPQSALTTGDNSLGGVLVPDEIETSIIVLRESRGVAAMEARLERMSSDTKLIPRYAEGPTAYFVGDNETITASDVKHDNVQLVAKKLAALVLASSEISEDAYIDIGDMITTHIAYAFADKEDECLFNGDGTSTYGGIVGINSALAAGTIVTAPAGDIAFSDLITATFESMVGKLPSYADNGGAAWYIHRAGWAASMARLADAAGGNTTETIAAGPSQRMFLGYPVKFVNVMNSTLADQGGATGVCYFGNISMAAAIGRRRGISIALSTDRYFELDQIAIRGLQRFDVNVHERGTATAAGPIIGLTLPSS
jgi:HK97 family phage major capsid protein